MSTIRTLTLAAALSLATSAALAGAGANIQACIYMPATPMAPFTANFTAAGNGTHCMNNRGNNVSVQVSGSGMTCGSAGYVEEKGSSSGGDTCGTDTSHWVLSYNATTSMSAYSGSTSVEMSRKLTHNAASMSNVSSGTNLCTTNALCNSTSQNWDHGSQGPLYIIFQPVSQSNN